MIFQEDLSTVGTLLDSLSEGVIVADSDGRFRYFNQSGYACRAGLAVPGKVSHLLKTRLVTRFYSFTDRF